MTNENAGHYLNMQDARCWTKGQNAVQYNTKWDTWSPYILHALYKQYQFNRIFSINIRCMVQKSGRFMCSVNEEHTLKEKVAFKKNSFVTVVQLLTLFEPLLYALHNIQLPVSQETACFHMDGFTTEYQKKN